MERLAPADIALNRALSRARLVLAWERLWPRLSVILSVIAVFCVVSWFGLFEALPRYGRFAVLFAFGAAFAAALLPLFRFSWPTIDEAVKRFDRDIGKPHRPVATAVDQMANATDDPVARALWAAHGRVAAQARKDGRLKPPAPGLAARDPYALRFIVVLALFVAFFHAGSERGERLFSAFREPPTPFVETPVRIDAWVTPPAYTRRPPVLLTEIDGRAPVSVPQGSTLVVRVAGDPTATIAVTGGASDPAADAPTPAPPTGGVVERRAVLSDDATAVVRRGEREAAVFHFAVIPDQPPTIALTEPIKPALRGSMTLTYRVEDDYGVTGVEGRFERPSAGTRPLYEPPRLVLPSTGSGEDRRVVTATRDVSEHPFAGASMALTLTARDAAGNVGTSEAVSVVLPGRSFNNPLARSLVELRRLLALDAAAKPWILQALDALLVAPDQFTKDMSVYLGLVSVRNRLDIAQSDQDLRGVVDYLWKIALRLEEGDLSDAERQLKAAQERLREALERGASEEEIRKLTQELRQAMNQFLNEMARQQAQRQRNGDNPLSRPSSENERMVTQQDLNQMLDRMEQMMRDGAREQAQQLLSELNQMLDNLQTGEPSEMAQDPAMREMQQSLNELNDMIQRQQRLRDQTFRESQRRPGDRGQPQEGQQGSEGQQGQQEGNQGQGSQPGQEGQSGMGGQGGQGQGGMEGLRQRQEALRRQLEAMQRRLQEQGAGEGSGPLGEAGNAMQGAEGQLGEGNGEGAVGSQGDALEALRRGAQSLAQQLQQQGQGQAGQPSQGRNGRAQRGGEGTANGEDRDPLGRPTRSRSYSDGMVRVPGRGETAAERAARVLEELRRRLSDPNRPRYELDYLERLLRRD